MSQLGVFLARQELRVVFDNFDQNKDGNIAYSEFVNVLKVSFFFPFPQSAVTWEANNARPLKNTSNQGHS